MSISFIPSSPLPHARSLQTTDFDLDYFNKSITPLDVHGRPVLTQQERADLALEQQISASGKPLSKAGSARVAAFDEENDEDDFAVPLLPVDKGIFRRKLAAQTVDEEMGLSGSAGGGSSSKGLLGGGDEESLDFGGKDGPKKGSLGKRMASIKEASGSGGSAQSLLSFIGLGSKNNSNVDPQMPILLKNDDNFLEHRKLLVQRWKENIRNKLLNQSPHDSFYDSDKEEEVLDLVL